MLIPPCQSVVTIPPKTAGRIPVEITVGENVTQPTGHVERIEVRYKTNDPSQPILTLSLEGQIRDEPISESHAR